MCSCSAVAAYRTMPQITRMTPRRPTAGAFQPAARWAPPRRSMSNKTTQPSWQQQLAGQRRSLPPCRSSSQGTGRDMDSLLYSDEVPLAQLQQQLEAAVEDEDYAAAAQIRDVLQRRRFDGRLAVEEANERFYKAFQSGSVAAMSEVWGKGDHVQCIHPLAGCIAGRQSVMESWRMILGSGRMRITVEDVRVFASDSQAFVTCVEVTESSEGRGRIAATNIFEKQEGKWKLVHHHGSPAPR